MLRDLLLLLLLAGCAVILIIHGRQLKPNPNSHIAGLSGSPGIQMEFAKNAADVSGLLGDSGPAFDNRNWAIMRQQQYLDFLFIVFYWSVFFYVIGGPLRGSGLSTGRILGYLLCIFISITAVADYLEDAGILFALSASHQGVWWPFPFCITKWLFAFLSLGVAGWFLLFYPKFAAFAFPVSKLTVFPARFTGTLFLTAAVSGLIGTISALFNRGSLVLLGGLLSTIGSAVLLIVFILGALAASHHHDRSSAGSGARSAASQG